MKSNWGLVSEHSGVKLVSKNKLSRSRSRLRPHEDDDVARKSLRGTTTIRNHRAKFLQKLEQNKEETVRICQRKDGTFYYGNGKTIEATLAYKYMDCPVLKKKKDGTYYFQPNVFDRKTKRHKFGHAYYFNVKQMKHLAKTLLREKSTVNKESLKVFENFLNESN